MLAATGPSDAIAILSFVLSVISLGVAGVNAMRSFDQVRYNKRIDLSHAFLVEFFGQEFTIVQRGAWKVREMWFSDPQSHEPTARYFCTDFFNPHDSHVVKDDKESNSLTPLQNVTRFMSFWHRLVALHAAGLVEPPVIRPLESHYVQWARFMRELAWECEQVTKVHEATNYRPQQWQEMCKVLDRLDWNKSVTSGDLMAN